MLAKIKALVENSLVWMAGLLGIITILWLKERDLEDKLAEEKADAKIKDAKEAVKEADDHAQSSSDKYEELRKQYINDKLH